MEAVAKRPVSVAIDAGLSTFQSYKTGVYDDANNTQAVNHGGEFSLFIYFKFLF
jgi:hypothetical protein